MSISRISPEILAVLDRLESSGDATAHAIYEVILDYADDGGCDQDVFEIAKELKDLCMRVVSDLESAYRPKVEPDAHVQTM